MPMDKIPLEWDLGADPRYKRQNMEMAMRGKIERGLVELITNSDDSYRNLEEQGKQVSGKIRIEIERRKKGHSLVIVRDKACGMNRKEMYDKLGALGRRTSGFEEGKARRGLHGRGARDIVAFGKVRFESIKDEEYNHLIIPPSLKCCFTEPRPKKTTSEIRKKLGILKGNGTIVTIEVENRFKILQHETLKKDFSRYYSLRDIFSNPLREVIIVDLNKHCEDRLFYNYPQGEIVFDKNITIPHYPEAAAQLIIRKYSTAFNQENLPYRQGILVKSGVSIHDCTYFELESEPFSWRFTGELQCDFIDKLIREYDDREELNADTPNHPENNHIRLLNAIRDGLIREHLFAQSLYKKCKEILQNLVEDLKATELPPKRDMTNENLDRKLTNLSKDISKLFEKKLIELGEEEEIPTTDEDDPKIKQLPIGLHIIPPDEQPIIVDKYKTFSLIVKHHETLDESLPISILSNNPENVRVRMSPVYLKKFSEDKKFGTSAFILEGLKVETESIIEVRYDGYEKLLHINVIEPPPPPELPIGLSFEKPQYHLRINKEKTLILWLKTAHKFEDKIVETSSDNPEIVIKGGGRSELHKTDKEGIFRSKIRVEGRQLKLKGTIWAKVEGFEPVYTKIVVEESPPTSELRFKPPYPVPDNFEPLRYKWDYKDPLLLLIGAEHPSIKKYLGEPTEQGYPGINDPLYHTVLAEVIAEAFAFLFLEKNFKREGGMLVYPDTDTYYHKHLSDFLSITHKHLVPE